MKVRSQKPRVRSQNDEGKTVAAYLAALPKDSRAALMQLRKTIRAAAPEAIEDISYGMPAFKHKGTLVYYAAFKGHCSFFPASVAVMRQFAGEVEDYDTTGKGTIRFTVADPLPSSLVKRMVKARIAENEARQALRSRR